jgi:hypothetical protein
MSVWCWWTRKSSFYRVFPLALELVSWNLADDTLLYYLSTCGVSVEFSGIVD